MRHNEQDKQRALELFKSENPDSGIEYFEELPGNVQRKWMKEVEQRTTRIKVTTVRMQYKRTGGHPDGVKSYNIHTGDPTVALATALKLLAEDNNDSYTLTNDLTEVTMYFKQEIVAHEPRV